MAAIFPPPYADAAFRSPEAEQWLFDHCRQKLNELPKRSGAAIDGCGSQVAEPASCGRSRAAAWRWADIVDLRNTPHSASPSGMSVGWIFAVPPVPVTAPAPGLQARCSRARSCAVPTAEREAASGTVIVLRSNFASPSRTSSSRTRSARGTSSKFRYPSHRLRFDVQRPLDATTDGFIARINAAAEREDDVDPINPRDPNWLLGDRQRHQGPLHNDIWARHRRRDGQSWLHRWYPAKGRWGMRPAQGRFDLPARYSFAVSIRTPETDVDLYTPIARQVAAQAPVPVVVTT